MKYNYSNNYKDIINKKINLFAKFLLIIFIINFLYYNRKKYPKKKIILNLQREKRIEQLIKGKIYINTCLKGLLINKKL